MLIRKHWTIYNPYSSNRKKSYGIDQNGEEVTKGILAIKGILVIKIYW